MKSLLLLLPALIFAMLTGCGGEPVSNEYVITESAMCNENGFAARIIKSSWDDDIIGVQCYTPRKFEPYQTEFVLTDGTRCVMFSTPAATTRRAGSSGVSCDWNFKEENNDL